MLLLVWSFYHRNRKVTNTVTLFGKMSSEDAVRLLTRVSRLFRTGLTSHVWWSRGLRHTGTERRPRENKQTAHGVPAATSQGTPTACRSWKMQGRYGDSCWLSPLGPGATQEISLLALVRDDLEEISLWRCLPGTTLIVLIEVARFPWLSSWTAQ